MQAFVPPDLVPARGLEAWTEWQVVQSREALPCGPDRNWALEAVWQVRHCLFFLAADSVALKAKPGTSPFAFTCASEPAWQAEQAAAPMAE